MILPILATAGLSLVLYLTGFFVIFTPLPYLLTSFKKGWGASLAATAVSLAVLFMLYRLPAQPLTFLPMMAFYPALSLKVVMGLSVLYLAYFIWMAWVVTIGSRTLKDTRVESGFAGMMLGILVPSVIAYLLLAFFLDPHLSQNLADAFQGLLQKMVALQGGQAGEPSNSGGAMSGEELAYLKDYAPELVRGFFALFPSLWIVFTMMVLSLNLLFVRRWLPAERPFPRWEDFNLWRLREAWIWLPISMGAFYFANAYGLHNDWVEIGVINGLIVIAAVYFYQGLAIVSYFFRRRLSPWMRLAAYAVIFLFLQVVGVLILAVGLFDFWFDFRKLKKVA